MQAALPVEADTLGALCAALTGSVDPAADWEAVIELANRSNTTPILASRLHDHPALPAELRAFLGEVRSRLQRRNAMLHAQLIEAVAILGARGIKPLLLKGSAVLAERGWERCPRLSIDIDLMVPPAAMLEALAALEAVGYRRTGKYFTPETALNLERGGDAGALDLHCRLKVPRPALDYAAMSEGASDFPLGDAIAAMPSPTVQAGQILIHDLLQEHDYWRGLIDLRHLFDLRELGGGAIPIDWTALESWFPQGHARRALELQLLTHQALFGDGLPVPPHPALRSRLQLRRRQFQLRHPGRRPILTVIAVLLDPPWYPRALRRHAMPGPAEGWTSFIDRQFLSPRFGKL